MASRAHPKRHPRYYSRRDLIGHFVDREQHTQRPCGHPCCRNYRVHPANYPVILPDRTLHRASDKDLMTHWSNVEGDDSGKGERARAQLLAEMQRRDDAEERRRQAHAAYRARLVSRKLERAEAIEREYRAAETATIGYMLNRRGREQGISARSLMTGPESRVRKYGSDELIAYFEEHGRPTEAYFEGRDTRIGYANAGIRRRITSEEAAWRDAYDRAEYNIEHGLAA